MISHVSLQRNHWKSAPRTWFTKSADRIVDFQCGSDSRTRIPGNIPGHHRQELANDSAEDSIEVLIIKGNDEDQVEVTCIT